MSLTKLKDGFEDLKTVASEADPAKTLKKVGEFALNVLTLLNSQCNLQNITWKGKGAKTYQVFVVKGAKQPFSSAVNVALFETKAAAFKSLWSRLLNALTAGRKAGANTISGISGDAVDKTLYTAIISFAAATDLYNPGNRGAPGALFEIAVGAAIAYLTGRPEDSQVVLPIPDSGEALVVKSEEVLPGDESPSGKDEGAIVREEERGSVDDTDEEEDPAVVKTDRCFRSEPVSLIVALKISTRERISQVSVQQLILDKIKPGAFRSILCACNENNVFGPKNLTKAQKTYDICWLKDTLVPRTIALYHRYVARFAGIYYLDPPHSYLSGVYRGLPPIKRFRDLLTTDLPMLFAPVSNSNP